MLVTIDVGNSNITIGLFDGADIKGTFRMTTKIPRTSDEYGIFFMDLLAARKIPMKEIRAVIIASVVPDVMHSLTSGILKYFHVQPIIVGPGIRTGIKLATENPRELGADRIVDAVAAYELYGGPVVVIVFGTATTHDLVTEEGSLVAGVISPGIRISANTLWNNAAKLPEIEIRKPESILAKNTVTSMQAGLIYGGIGQTEYIVRKIQEEAGLKNIKVVATGGLGKIISQETKVIDIYDADLTLKGLRLIYEKQER